MHLIIEIKPSSAKVNDSLKWEGGGGGGVDDVPSVV